jgi:hypothetical protein
MNKQAHFSQDGKHRFWLLRSWDENPRMVTIIGLNPSTADAQDDDPTIRSCIRIATHNGFGGFVMVNLFSFISAYPDKLKAAIAAGDAMRDETDTTIARMVANSHKTICAWGSWNFIDQRVQRVLELIEQPCCLGINANGSPKHPLYQKTETVIIPYKF